MSIETQLQTLCGSPINQDDSSLLNFISYLRRYVFLLQTYLTERNEERYVDNQHRAIQSPMTYASSIEIVKEIQIISNIIFSYEKFRNNSNGNSTSTES